MNLVSVVCRPSGHKSLNNSKNNEHKIEIPPSHVHGGQEKAFDEK
jgi:hypothetical protein